MTGKRKRYSAEFKAKVALEAIRGELTVAQLVAKHGMHQTVITAWKKQAVDGMAGMFSGKAEAVEAAHGGEVEKLHAMRPRQPIHQSALHQGLDQCRYSGVDGRVWPVDGQRVHRAAVAIVEIRVRLPQRLRDRQRGQGRDWPLDRLLQHRPAALGVRRPNPGRGPSGPTGRHQNGGMRQT